MFRIINPTNVYHSANVVLNVSGNVLTFPHLKDNDVVVNLNEDNKAVDIYYHSQVSDFDKVLTITAIDGSDPKLHIKWNEIITICKLLGDIPEAERLLWHHIAEWLTIADKSTYYSNIIGQSK